MHRTGTGIEKFDRRFPKPHNLLIALHSTDLAHALEWAKIAYDNGADGVALVTHVISPEAWIDHIMRIKEKYPHHQAILNILQWSPEHIFRALKKHENAHMIDGVWVDNPKIEWVSWTNNDSTHADRVKQTQDEMNRGGLYFGGVNFKHQRQIPEEELGVAIAKAKNYLDVLTTSGDGTGISADASKVELFKSIAGKYPVWLASGVTPENFHEYAPNANVTICASWVSDSYYDLNPKKVLQLAEAIEKYNKNILRKEYEQYLLTKYNLPSVWELKRFLLEWNYINISSWVISELEKKLSNLYPTPFVLDGVTYASVEAFRMAMKFPEDDERRNDIVNLSWIKAKFAWNPAKFTKVVYYQWKQIPIWSAEHHALLKRAIRAKLEQHPDILQLLLESEERPIVHIPFTRHEDHVLPDSRNIPAEDFSQIIMELREEFRKS